MAETWQYPCPSCTRPLFVGRAQTVVLHGCGHCRGVWLDTDDAMRALQGWLSAKDTALAARVDAAPEPAEGGAYRVSARSEAAQARRCPHCKRELEPSVARADIADGTVQIEACSKHGVWFDRGELVRIAGAAQLHREALAEGGERTLRMIAVLGALDSAADELRVSSDMGARAAGARLSALITELRSLL